MRLRVPSLPGIVAHLQHRRRRLEALGRLFGYWRKAGSLETEWIVKTIGVDQGHIRSVKARRSVDAEGGPIPWYTYPAIEYLKQFDYTGWDAFEYGGGNSSRYWSARCRTLTTVESDPAWHAKLVEDARPTQTLHLEQDPKRYAEAIDLGDRQYRLIVIDGQHRRACAARAVERLDPRGLIVFDNSDWWVETTAYLRGRGLLQVDFTGIGPINCYTFTTSVFFGSRVELESLTGRQPAPGIGSLQQSADEEE